MISLKYFKGLPLEYEAFMADRYDSFLTNCRYFEVYYPNDEFNYVIVTDNGNLIELLVFSNRGNTCHCFNSLVSIDQKIIEEFIKIIFETYPTIQKIKIDASNISYDLKKSISLNKLDDYILNLPSTIEEYHNILGSNTRQTIKNRKVRLLRDYPKVKFIIKYGSDIEVNIVNKIVQLNHERMKQKGKTSGIDAAYNEKIYKYAQYYGCTSYIEIDGIIVAGCISSIINKTIFGHITSFDINYSKYKVGEICAFHMIQTSIEKGITKFNFLWGKSDLKDRLKAKPHTLFSYYIFRSYSIEYLFHKVKNSIDNEIIYIKDSKYSKPLKQIAILYRKRV